MVGSSTSWMHRGTGRRGVWEECDSDGTATLVSEELGTTECMERLVHCVEGDVDRRGKAYGWAKKPSLCPSQQSNPPTNTTSSHSPRASRLGSTSLSPTSVCSMSFPKTPRNIFMA
jgi:hypothetical protein